MQKPILLSTFIVLNLSLHAQTFQLDTNSISATIQTTGTLFNDATTSSHGFEALNGNETFSIYSTSLWMAGEDVNGQIKGCIGAYGLNDESYIPGPLTVIQGTGNASQETQDFGPATITPIVSQSYNQIYTVTATEIDEFVNWHNCSQDQNCDVSINFPGYSIPPSILDWPAHGDISQDQGFFLAPYFDLNGNGFYEPLNGEYPCIKGDKYAWIILNDKNPNNTSIDPIGVEIHVEIYAFDRDISSPLDRTIFVGYDIINRSTQTLNNFYIGAFCDFDIGCVSDDYIGSLPELNSVFGYNSTTTDFSCSSNNGYGNTPPAQGMVILNDSMTSSISYLSAGNGYQVMPNSNIEYYECLKGNFKDGSAMYYGGDGHPGSSGVTSTPYNYIYPEAAPLGLNQWTENTQVNPGGDKKMLAVTGGDVLSPGKVVELDLAFVYSRASSGDHLASIQSLEDDIPIVQQFYDDSIAHCYFGDISLDIPDYQEIRMDIFPNPFNEELTLDNSGGDELIGFEIFNGMGQLIDNGIIPPHNSLNYQTSSLEAGIYLVKVRSVNNSNSFSRVLIKE